MLEHLERSSLGRIAAGLYARMVAAGTVPGDRFVGGLLGHCNDPADCLPALVCSCSSTLDIVSAVALAQQSLLPLSVRYDLMEQGPKRGGSDMPMDFCGTRSGALPSQVAFGERLVADLTAMRLLFVDADGGIATCSGGIRVREIVAAAAQDGLEPANDGIHPADLCNLLVTGGSGSPVGSFLTSSAALAEARVVLMDQRVVAVSSAEHEDIFRAIRWGSCDAGIVAALKLRLQAEREYLAGIVTFPWSQRERVFSGYIEMVAAGSPNLAIAAGIASLPDGEPRIVLAPCWSGERGEGEAAIAAVRALGEPLSRSIVRGPLRAVLDLHDENFRAAGILSTHKYRLPQLSRDVLERVIVAGAMGEPFSSCFLHHFFGASEGAPTGRAASRPLSLEVFSPQPKEAGRDADKGAGSLFWIVAPQQLPVADSRTQRVALRRKYDPAGIFEGKA